MSGSWCEQNRLGLSGNVVGIKRQGDCDCKAGWLGTPACILELNTQGLWHIWVNMVVSLNQLWMCQNCLQVRGRGGLFLSNFGATWFCFQTKEPSHFQSLSVLHAVKGCVKRAVMAPNPTALVTNRHLTKYEILFLECNLTLSLRNVLFTNNRWAGC